MQLARKQLNSPFQLLKVFFPEDNQGWYETEEKVLRPKGFSQT